jgi:hypothetical protein
MCLRATVVLIVMDDGNSASHGSSPNRTFLRNIVMKSSFSRIRGAKLNFAHLKPGSAVPYIDEMNKLFHGVDIQLIAVSETWFKSRHTNRQVNLHGDRVVRADKGGGGVALYMKDGMRYKVVARSSPSSVVDYFFIELRLPYPLLVCVIYNPPNINGFSIYGTELEPLVSQYSDILVLGDFNHDILKTENRVTKFLEDLKNLNLHVHSNFPTNYQGQPAEDKLDSGPILFSPDELNTVYSSDIRTNNSYRSNQSDSFVFRTVSFSVIKNAIRSINISQMQLGLMEFL